MTNPDDDFDLDAFDEAFAKEFGQPLDEEPQEEEPEDEPGQPPTLIVLVLTPVADARVLAKLMGLVGIDWPVFPTRTGAAAATVLEIDDMAQLTGSLPEEAVKVAGALSQTSEYGVVLLASQVGQSNEGATGQVQAARYVGGAEIEKLSPGVVLAGADETVEKVIFGNLAPGEATGVLDPAQVAEEEGDTPPPEPPKRRWGRKPR